MVPGEVGAQDGVAAGVAQRGDLLEQPGGVAAAPAFAHVLVQVGLERVELAGPWSFPAAVGEFLPGGGAGVPLDGVQSPAQVPGDLAQPASLSEQVVHDRVVAPGPVGVLPGRIGPYRGLRLCRRFRPGGGPGLQTGVWRWFWQAGAVRGDAPLGRLGQVLP